MVLACTLALSAAIALFAVVVAVAGHGEALEAAWWLAAFGVVAPLTVIGAGRLLRAAASPAGAQALQARAVSAFLALALALAAARAAGALPLSLLAVLAVPALALRGPAVLAPRACAARGRGRRRHRAGRERCSRWARACRRRRTTP